MLPDYTILNKNIFSQQNIVNRTFFILFSNYCSGVEFVYMGQVYFLKGPRFAPPPPPPRVCYGQSLSWTKFVMGRNIPESTVSARQSAQISFQIELISSHPQTNFKGSIIEITFLEISDSPDVVELKEILEAVLKD